MTWDVDADGTGRPVPDMLADPTWLTVTRHDAAAAADLPAIIELRADRVPTGPVSFRSLPTVTFIRESELHRRHDTPLTVEDVDLVVPDSLVPALVAAVQAAPQASLVLTQLIRATEHLPITEALLMESMAYSLLQAGPEYAAWRASRRAGPAASTATQADSGEPQVLVRHTADTVTVELDRVDQANALGQQMRHTLVETMTALLFTAEPIILRGRGRHFCSGGDLNEFGAVPDPVRTHRIRTTQALPLSVSRVGHRLTAYVHGSCVGAGVELSAFAARVVALPDTTFRLPEVSMGLLPGCGGTVSLPRRIGRSRSLLLMLTGAPVSAQTARDWGLVDLVRA